MKTPRIYCDTSVFGGVYDDLFSEASRRFFELIREGSLILVISPVVGREIEEADAPDPVKATYREMLAYGEIVDITDEAIELQQAYIQEGIVSTKWEDDALHVAVATVHECSVIVSWNFKHIVNYRRIPLYNAVNTLKGYTEIAIFSPLEVIEDE